MTQHIILTYTNHAEDLARVNVADPGVLPILKEAAERLGYTFKIINGIIPHDDLRMAELILEVKKTRYDIHGETQQQPAFLGIDNLDPLTGMHGAEDGFGGSDFEC